MITRLASKYIKDLNFDTREKREEIKRVVRLKFLDFCKVRGVQDSVKSYREHRSVVRSLYGFDIPIQRPAKEFNGIETTLEMF